MTVKNSDAIDSIVNSVRKNNHSSMTVKSAESLGSGYVRIIATATKKVDQKTNIGNLVRQRFDNKLHPIENSFTLLSSNTISDTFTGILSVNPQAVYYTDETEGFRLLAGNMYADEEENLWELKKSESGKVLVKAFGKEDAEYVEELMQSCSSTTDYDYESAGAISNYNKMVASADGGDFVIYINPKNDEVSLGAILASVVNKDGTDTDSVYVVDKNQTSSTVSRKMILAKVADVEIPESLEAGIASVSANLDPMAMQKIEEYYKKVYGYNQAYYEKFIALFKKHVFA